MVARNRTPRSSGCSIWGLRYYSPDQGRWLSRDPLGDAAFRTVPKRRRMPSARKLVNLYRAFANDPNDKIDAFGLEPGIPIEVRSPRRPCCPEDFEGRSERDICREGCALYKKTRPPSKGLGATICYGGRKCACAWLDRFSEKPDPRVLTCVLAHELVHVRDPRLHCEGRNPCRPDPPWGASRYKPEEIECPAFYAALQCLMLLPVDTPGHAEAWDMTYKMYLDCKETGRWQPLNEFL
jgi:RHS repeat-associated protein